MLSSSANASKLATPSGMVALEAAAEGQQKFVGWVERSDTHPSLVHTRELKKGLQEIEWVVLGDHSGGKACG
jgi:hypothetical protein